MSEQIAIRIPERQLQRLDELVERGRFASRAAAVRRSIELLLLAEREAEIAAEYRRAYGEHPQEEWIGEAGLRLGAAMLARQQAVDETGT